MERLNKRTERLLTQEKENAYECKENDVQYEVELPNDSKESLNEFEYLATPLFHQKEVQCSLPVPGKYSIDNFRFDDKSVKYYTGFSTYEHFMFLFHCLGQAAYELTYQCSSLEPKDQLFLTIMKLRCAKDDIELSIHFKISESTVSRIFTTWINFLFFQLQEIDIWPSRKLIDQHMPSDFKKKFPRTRVILDATEFPIQKPSDVNLQSATWSAYKHRNTIKTMIGCSPRGAVSFVSDTFCGSVSDRQIIENSDLLNKASTFEKNDSIMADRGIMVQDLFATRDVMVNTPTMLKGKSQLEPSEIVHDRRVASKRIHIERIIGLSKKYKILKQELPHSKLPLGNRIVKVCFYLVNFKKVIVNKSA